MCDAPRYPHIRVRIVDVEHCTAAIAFTVARAMLEGGVDRLAVAQFFLEATSGDAYHALLTALQTVDCFDDSTRVWLGPGSCA